MKTVRPLNHFDECECGDYRLNHEGENHTGRCSLPDDLTHGFQPCRYFRLFQPATKVPAGFWANTTVVAK